IWIMRFLTMRLKQQCGIVVLINLPGQTVLLLNSSEDRQILDGPFIINDIISWCKQNRFKGMLFKVDFAKAFDSVKWEFLEETLKSFGFSPIWCKWIKGCLNNARGSVLVNGSPTSEFQFFKGIHFPRFSLSWLWKLFTFRSCGFVMLVSTKVSQSPTLL
ncbi:RNA-directed DNA polymerase, eukaryota, partial [Tanacetum coccineum]